MRSFSKMILVNAYRIFRTKSFILSTVMFLTLFSWSRYLLYQGMALNYQSFSYSFGIDDYLPGKRNYTYLLVRILSNDLVPLHGAEQTILNTKHILREEKLPEGFGRLWLLHSYVDSSKQQEAWDLLTSRKEWVEVMPLPVTRNVTLLQKAAFNLNKARNLALMLGFEAGADWVFPFDGCSFFPSESFTALQSFLTKQNQYLMHFMPMIRLQYKKEVSMESTYTSLFPYTSGQQECQIAISRNLYITKSSHRLFKDQSYFFFQESNSYGNQDKLSLLRVFNKQLNDTEVHCKEAFIGYSRNKARTPDTDLPLMHKCGYMIRLLYHPEYEAPLNQTLSAVGRGKLRFNSMVELTRKLAKFVNANISRDGDLPKFPWS